MSLLKKAFVISIVIIILAGGLLMVYLKPNSSDGSFDDLSFERQIWLQWRGSENPDNKRGLMYEDLLTKLIPGMTKQEVLMLLGEPDHAKTENSFSYILGMWSGMKMDYDTLEIKFDTDGQLIKAYRVQH